MITLTHAPAHADIVSATKPESHNAHIETPPEEDRATATDNTNSEFSKDRTWRYAHGQTHTPGYLQCRTTVAELMNKSDHDLFCKLCAPTHALNHLLPPARNHASLRTRVHSYHLPEYSTDLRKKSFLIRCLYSFVRQSSFWFICFVLDVILTLLFMFII